MGTGRSSERTKRQRSSPKRKMVTNLLTHLKPVRPKKFSFRVSELAVSLPFSPPPDGYQRQLCDIDREWIEEMDKYTFAKTCFDCREYSRAAFHLASCHSKKSVFLRGYALYLVISVRVVCECVWCEVL